MVFIPTLLVLATVATLTSADSVWINCDNDPAYATSSIKSSSLACDVSRFPSHRPQRLTPTVLLLHLCLRLLALGRRRVPML